MKSKAPRLSIVTAILMMTVLAPGRRVAAEGTEVWHIKAVHPEGSLLDVKAIDKDGGIHDVKAIQQTGNRHLLDIKAFVGGKVLPVKVLASGDWFGPVKAIDDDGTIIDIKALTSSNQPEKLDVKAVSRSGHILDIKAIGPQRQFYGIKAISPDGHVYDVKGVKMLEDAVELTIGTTAVRAHVKALPQVP